MTRTKCKNQKCYKVATIYGYCLVCWNKLSVHDRNKAVRNSAEYGKWQLDELDQNLLMQLEMQNMDGMYFNPDMSPINLNDALQANHFGMYFPPKDRIFYGLTLDSKNDGRLTEASVSIPATSNFNYEFYGDSIPENIIVDGIERDLYWRNFIQRTIYLRRIQKPPKGYLSYGSGDWYILLYGSYVKDLSKYNVDGFKFPTKRGIFYEKNYLRIDWKNERINLGIKRGMNYQNGGAFLRQLKARVTCLAATAISAEADSRFLWHVRAFKLVNNGELLQGNVRFGVYGEHVKSLFFARDLPLTPTGRKKPILHWVNAHKRRLKSGKDINIEKFLRGTRYLEIGDTTFLITRPCEKEEINFPQWSRKHAIYH